MELAATNKTKIPAILIGLCAMIFLTFGKTSNSGVHSMANSPIVIAIKDMPAKIICGGSINCAIELKNTSDQAVSVPVLSPVSSVQFEFDPAGGGSRRIISQTRFNSWMDRGKTVPVMEQQFTSLKGGDGLINSEGDLGQYAIEPLLPGEYKIIATLDLKGTIISSLPVSLTVCSPQIKILESYYSPRYQNVYSVFVEDKCFSRNVLFIRPSFSNNPKNGVAGIPMELSELPSALAAAEKIADDVSGQWLSWLVGNTVSGAWGDLNLKPRVFGSVEVSLGSPRLLPQGFTIENNAGVFFLIGDSKGETALQSVTFSEKGAYSSNPVPVCANAIVFVKVQYDMKGKYFSIFWIEKSNENEFYLKSGIYYDKTSVNLTDIHILFKTSNTPLALSVHSVAVNVHKKTGITALFKNVTDKSLTFIQMAAAPSEPSHPVSIPYPPGPADMWSISPSFDYNPLIVARSENHLLWLEVNGDSQWRTLAHDDQGISNVSLFTNQQNEYYAQWVNKKTGLRFEQVPYKIRPPM
jgi:hypothetical protein